MNLRLLMLRSPEQQLLRTTSQSGEGWDGRGNGQLLIHPGISGCISQPGSYQLTEHGSGGKHRIGSSARGGVTKP